MAVTFNVGGVRVAQDPVKGKVVVIERALKPGQVIFSEEEFVAASWSTELIMKNIEGIDEVDRARCILKCLALYERDANALSDVMGLTFTDKQLACDSALQLRRQLPDVFPAGFLDDQMATLIGVLNTNSRT
ncbi:hypothetical protein PsorP6_006950 [Peronosclerospora sorghi]|uniref:Uncharacterized protein n=1 Tax=Peronosclerospora sorghi TaxID=230839 RepID=A0ACC0WAA1_9STRA|nr:hypothetical protein PsorP6_006950 [Peronosclerospora sorghi]